MARRLPPPHSDTPLFQGFFLAGFECSDHKLEDGRRLDLLASTRHDELAAADYARMKSLGMTACRDGISWVRTERRCGRYDFAHASERVRAATAAGTQVSWDLMHFGWPDHVDPFAADFPARFGRYVRALATWFRDETDMPPMFTPINEMSFLAWAGADVGVMNPFERARSTELKAQFVLATIEAIEAIRSVLPHARFVHSEPVINIVPSPEYPLTWRRVECDNLLQYEALDMLSGRRWHQLGGSPGYVDIVGVNFYSNNQFMIDGTTIQLGDPRFKPFSAMLMDVWARYQRPMIVSETGAEGDVRASWLRYVADECVTAMQQGCPLHGLTLYPIIDHPGWVDDRHCPNGLWGYADGSGERPIHAPLADEIREQTPRLLTARAEVLNRRAVSVVGAEAAAED